MFFRRRRIYLDYASATPVLPEVQGVISDTSRAFGNPGAIHHEGVEAKKILLDAREAVALELGCKAREVIFVSGGTEANNLAILGFARKSEMTMRLNLNVGGRTSDISPSLQGTHWITSSIEHPSVLECFVEIERRGGIVTHVDPDARGIVSAESVDRSIRPQTVFVSIQWANHEIGTIQPLREIKKVLHAREEKNNTEIIFHTDMGQAPLYLSPQVHGLGVDIASIDSGKLYGPRGIGCVYVNNRVELAQVIVGGGQERGLRAGTENVALAAGFSEALFLIGKERESEAKRIRALRDALSVALQGTIPHAVLNGDVRLALPHILNISIPNISSEYVTLQLDRAGIAISTKSACREGEESRSHVVEALGNARSATSGGLSAEASAKGGALAKEERASNTLRFSLGLDTTERDIIKVSCVLAEIIESTNFQKTSSKQVPSSNS